MTKDLTPIETYYDGCRFRSRLEARWAVFFNYMGIRWEYEPQGFLINRPGYGTQTPYLPDFLLPDCGTWIEVKGNENTLSEGLMHDAAAQLPQCPEDGEQGPPLLVLGPIPRPGRVVEWDRTLRYDWGWVAPEPFVPPDPYPTDWHPETRGEQRYYGFGAYQKNLRPWYLDNANHDAWMHGPGPGYSLPADTWLRPVADTSETIDARAYTAARSARFEHGESGGVL